jgi:hypothetical protein
VFEVNGVPANADFLERCEVVNYLYYPVYSNLSKKLARLEDLGGQVESRRMIDPGELFVVGTC